MSSVIPFLDLQRSHIAYDLLREKADDLEQAVSLYLRALASNDPDKISNRLIELKYARNGYAAFRKK